jgi:mercuric ion transport protein
MRVIQLRQRAAVAAEPTSAQAGRWQTWLAAGGVVGALASSSCCILPLALFSLGASGAWLGNLSALSPYQPVFITITLGFLGAGFWVAYRRPRAACDEPATCARPASGRIVKLALWTAILLVVAALAFPYVAPTLLGA